MMARIESCDRYPITGLFHPGARCIGAPVVLFYAVGTE
jgi:hypothetical protein